jgi:UDP-4-amino-4,6-dideoxy-N-acetyl-beta-L-altrosamine N-acetyltransferase
MYTNHEISAEEHRSWFESVSKDPTKEYFVFELDGELCGVIGFVDIDIKSRTASWAFYSGDTTRRGLGSLMEVAALNYAFEILKIRKLSCEVLEFNEAVIKFHKKHGFNVEGVFVKQYFRDGRYFDIYRLAILGSDWSKCREEVISRSKTSFMPGACYTHSFTITSKQVDSFVLKAGGGNSVRTDEMSAVGSAVAGTIVQGLLLIEFSRVLAPLFSGEVATYCNQSLNFLFPVYPDMPLQADFRVVSKVGNRIRIETTISDLGSESLLAKGEATLLLPV